MGESEKVKSRYNYEFLISDPLYSNVEHRGYCEDYDIFHNEEDEPYMISFKGVTFGDENSEPEYEIYNVIFDDVKWIRRI